MKRLVLIPFLSLLALPALAADSADMRMHTFLQDVKSLKADFTQVVLDSNGKQVKQSTGTLVIKRPDRFRDRKSVV